MLDKPVVFLDFDGVVETPYWEKDKDGAWTYNIHKYSHSELNNKQAVGWLNQLYEEVPYDIVVTSTWRYGLEVSQLQELLVKSGFDKRIKVIDKTPVLYQTRGAEIAAWLEAIQFKNRFVILDDDSDMGSLLGCLVRCDSLLGFTYYDFEKAKRILVGTEDEQKDDANSEEISD